MCSQKSSSLQKYPSSAIDQYQHCNFLSFVTRNGFPGRISSWYMQTLCGVCNEGWCLATCFRNASLNPTHSVQRNHSSAMGLIIGYFLFGPFSISTSTSPQRGPNGVSFGRASDLSRFTVLLLTALGSPCCRTCCRTATNPDCVTKDLWWPETKTDLGSFLSAGSPMRPCRASPRVAWTLRLTCVKTVFNHVVNLEASKILSWITFAQMTGW